jgi:hypothetical protein
MSLTRPTESKNEVPPGTRIIGPNGDHHRTRICLGDSRTHSLVDDLIDFLAVLSERNLKLLRERLIQSERIN